LKFTIFILILVVAIAQGIYEELGVVGCLAPLVVCGAFFGLLALVPTFKEDNGDTKISFEPPARDKKSHEMAVSKVREMVGKQIRLVSVHWSDSEREEYLYSPDIEHSDKRRKVVSWMDEPTEDILSKSRYMVEPVRGEEDQIRLVSVRWSNIERCEYLYSPDIDYSLNSEEMREVVSWMDEPTEDILSKSRYMVEPVPGQEDVIRLVSVHWSDSERYEYLYTSREWTGASRRHIHSWKVEPTNDILSKSRYRVEFVHSSKEEEMEDENWWEDEN
tara:strand:- start:346 stop:1170 length:825 start_codon:yes stop_codon:yes gene_type:complete